MKNRITILLFSLIFLGCTKTINIVENREMIIHEEPVQTYESRPIYEEQVPYHETVNVRNEVLNLTPLEVYDRMQENLNLFLLDVRMVGEIAQDGKIANSVMIPLPVLAQNLNRLDKSKTIVVYCHTGNRSVEATQLLRNNGFTAINMLGGIEAWKKSHLSVLWK